MKAVAKTNEWFSVEQCYRFINLKDIREDIFVHQTTAAGTIRT